MTDKEIIIDGVDVSEWTDEEVRYKFEKHSPKAIRQIAFDLYKQLARKEQECEELKQWKKDAENLFKTQTDNADKIINRYKQALDEIEEIANKQRKFDLTGKTPLTPVINEVGEDFIDILDIINKANNGE